MDNDTVMRPVLELLKRSLEREAKGYNGFIDAKRLKECEQDRAAVCALLAEPAPVEGDARKVTAAELNLIRQWFNSVQDTTPDYLEAADYVLARRLGFLPRREPAPTAEDTRPTVMKQPQPDLCRNCGQEREAHDRPDSYTHKSQRPCAQFVEDTQGESVPDERSICAYPMSHNCEKAALKAQRDTLAANLDELLRLVDGYMESKHPDDKYVLFDYARQVKASTQPTGQGGKS